MKRPWWVIDENGRVPDLKVHDDNRTLKTTGNRGYITEALKFSEAKIPQTASSLFLFLACYGIIFSAFLVARRIFANKNRLLAV